MGWQDRDYAKYGSAHGTVWRAQRPTASGGRSIVTTLIIINVAVFVLGAISPGAGELLFGLGAMQAQAVMEGGVWRLITAQYLHAGLWHLAFNMIGLHFLGRSLEQMWSTRRFLAIYTLCGLFGYVFYTVLASQHVIGLATPAVGASGCILGLLGIMAVRFPTATVFIFPIPFPLKIRTVAYALGGLALWMIITRGSNYGGEACHLAGLGFGVWWAMKGERWWASTRWGLPRGRSPRAGRGFGSASPTKKGAFRTKVTRRREDAATVDHILKKVYDGGIHSLTEAEKRALQEATERQREREQDADRVDRL